MQRREALRLGAQAVALTAMPAGLIRACGAPATNTTHNGIYYSESLRNLVVANAKSGQLSDVISEWASSSPEEIMEAADAMVASRNIVIDMRTTVEAMTRHAILQIIDPTTDREAALISGIQAMIDLPKWDYFLDGPDVIGIMRSSMANARLLLVRDVLGSSLNSDDDANLLGAIAEKGCLPCYRTIIGMNDPASVIGWQFDENHRHLYDINLDRWPEILGANNLRAIPTMGLGLGSLALIGIDDRAEEWLETAVASARKFLSFVSPDGSYFEGLSYIDYAFRTLFGFFDAHQRIVGDIKWIDEFNAQGTLNFILAMQAGRTPDGQPDIVNFSDSRKSVFPCIPAWIARETNSPVAQFAVEKISEPGYFLDFLWVDQSRPLELPPDALKNARLDLGWIISRTGWGKDDAVLAFRSGGPANHEHADRNTFMYKVFGERLLTDQFGAAYDWRDEGWLLRKTEAHNGVLIDGKGHQYHNGEEGTNESQASAKIVKYETKDDLVSWTSDATQAYQLVNDDVQSVVRTIAFAKPGLIIIRDSIVIDGRSRSASVRFFPDDRDQQATLEAGDQSFTIERPNAKLFGYVFSDDTKVSEGKLDLSEEIGHFPFIEITAPASGRHEIVTVLVARQTGDEEEPLVHVVKADDAWMFEVDNISGKIDSAGEVPSVEWFQ